MIRATLFTCAGSGSVDARFNTLSVFHIMEQINAPQFPVPIAVSIVGMFTREQGDPSTIDLQLRIFSGEQQLFAGPVSVNFQQHNRARMLLDMQGLVVPAPLDVRFLLQNGGDTIGTWIVAVTQVGPPALQLNLPDPARVPPIH